MKTIKYIFKKLRIKTIIITILMLILLLASHLLGFAKGLDNLPNPKSGTYNIEVDKGNKVIITTKIQYIEPNKENEFLLIHGVPTHE